MDLSAKPTAIGVESSARSAAEHGYTLVLPRRSRITTSQAISPA